MVSTLSNTWRNVRELTARMLAAARAEDWVQVARLEAERQVQLSEWVAARGTDTGVDVATEFQELLAEDRELLQLTVSAREELGHQLAELSQGRKARAAYGQTGKVGPGR